MKKKKLKKPTGEVDEDWEKLKRAFKEAGKRGGEEGENRERN